MTQFEVRCLNCKVSFPVGTKTCLHCGARLGKPAISIGGSSGPQLGARDAGPYVPGPVTEDEDADELLGQRSGLRIGLGGMWVVLAVIVTIIRSCTGG